MEKIPVEGVPGEDPMQESAWDKEGPKLAPEEQEVVDSGHVPKKSPPKKLFRFWGSDN